MVKEKTIDYLFYIQTFMSSKDYINPATQLIEILFKNIFIDYLNLIGIN